MGNIWKKVNLSGQSGYWAQFDEDTLQPIDLDEDGNIKVYKNPNDSEPVAFGTNPRATGEIKRERDDKFAAQERARQIDEKVKNSGAWKFANAISYAPYATLLPMAAKIAPTFAPGSPFWMHPLTKATVFGELGGNTVNLASRLVTGNDWDTNVGNLVEGATKKINSWAVGDKDARGWNPNSTWGGRLMTGLSNPGYWNPSAVERALWKGSEAVGKAATLYNSPLTGRWTRIGGREYRFSPNSAGMNGRSIESRPTPVEEIFEPNHWYRFRNPKYVTEADKETLASHLPEYKTIQEKAMDEGNYMKVSKDFPMSEQLEDGSYIFTGPEGAWIQSQSADFQRKFGGQKLKIGFKGGQDQKIEGVANTHSPETFPLQDNGVFFTRVRQYADQYNNGEPSPGFWLGFRRPYDMIDGGKRPFLLEDNNVRFVRSVEASPSFKGEFPDQTFKTLHRIWNSDFIDDPEVMKLLTTPLAKLTPEQLQQRYNLLLQIRRGQVRRNRDLFFNNLETKIKSGQYQPMRGIYYDGYIGRDHAFGLGEYNGVVKDEMWPFGSFPETYVIKFPQQAALLEGNNGAFLGPRYSRKYGGKLNHQIKIKKK